ncbi:hypothetical protein [Bacillus niameyensis]|uniref:hypothetical protein n=1 Tax=Bacillus niameyensis TaxID=1522308 RepID=UPI000782138B|nr:hypothetical protein [Bacillus niameyensis]
MDFEKWLRNELKGNAESMNPPDHLRQKITSSIKNSKSRSSKIKKTIIAALAAFILIPIGAFAQNTVIPSLVEKTIGTPEEASLNWNISSEGYKQRIQEMAVAEKYLTKEELEDYVDSKRQLIEIGKKATKRNNPIPFDLERLNQEDYAKYQKLEKRVSKYETKFLAPFNYTKEEAEEIMGYPIRYPTYIPDGFYFEQEEVEPEITLTHPKPIVGINYRNGEFGFTIYQSEQITGSRDPFEIRFDAVETYQLQGNTIYFGEYSDSNVKGMKMLIAATERKPARQIVIIDDILPQDELEKVLLSILETEEKL